MYDYREMPGTGSINAGNDLRQSDRAADQTLGPRENSLFGGAWPAIARSDCPTALNSLGFELGVTAGRVRLCDFLLKLFPSMSG